MVFQNDILFITSTRPAGCAAGRLASELAGLAATQASLFIGGCLLPKLTTLEILVFLQRDDESCVRKFLFVKRQTRMVAFQVKSGINNIITRKNNQINNKLNDR